MPTPLPLDSRNANSLWASGLVETLHRCGLRQVVVSPGSRSTPLTFAFAQHPGIEAIPVLDERSAAFFALGLAKQTGVPVALLCTSGTAGANYLPAIIEAHESGVPLLVLTADRPPELRDCASGQTIDQQKLFGGFVRFYHELAVPEAQPALLRYLRQTTANAWRVATAQGGPVHLNIPFRDPLVPTPDDGEAARCAAELGDSFFAHLGADAALPSSLEQPLDLARLRAKRGLIVAGPESAEVPSDYAAHVSRLAVALGWPILADGVSPLRHHSTAPDSLVVTAYDAILRDEETRAVLAPAAVLCLGDWPTSKVLRAAVGEWEPEILLVSPHARNRDALHGRTRQICAAVTALRVSGEMHYNSGSSTAAPVATAAGAAAAYRAAWAHAESVVRAALDTALATASQSAEILEAAVVPVLARALPRGAAVFVGSSMPIRDVEYFWPKTEHEHAFFFNRGANGIDGTLSTALGIAHGQARSCYLFCGDLSFLHDSGGMLLASKLRGSLTVILVNNDGGGIFEHLPVADYEPPFETFFATPQQVDIGALCAAHGVAHKRIDSLAALENELCAAAPPNAAEAARRVGGLRILELRTDRKHSAQARKSLFAEIVRPGFSGSGDA